MTLTPKPQRKRKKGLGFYKRKLWKLVSEYIRTRDCLDTTGTKEEGLCISCGARKRYSEADAGHFISRVHQIVAYDERNIFFQCKRCNGYLKGNFVGYINALKRRFGDGYPNLLLDLAEKNPVKQWNVFEIEELIEYYKRKIEMLGQV